MDSMSWRMLKCLGLLLLTSLVDTQRIILRPGRHVCRQQKIVMVPVLRTKSVCVPFYQRNYRPCHNSHGRLCPVVRLVYRTEFRRVSETVPRRHTYFSCCPGWTGYDVTHNTCRIPVCDPRCHHGGNCLLPNRCKCPDGWNGTSCQSDIDECSSSPCDQKCTNTGGSFRCECFQGYRLDVDGHHCILCLSCTDEFTNILQDQKRLQKTINELEEHNHMIMKNLTTLHKDLSTLSNMTSHPRPTTRIPNPTPEGKRESVEDIKDELDAYLSSLSEQISMLEERLHVCTCTQSSSSRVGMGKLKPGMEPIHRKRISKNTDKPTTMSPNNALFTTPLITTTRDDFIPLRTPSK